MQERFTFPWQKIRSFEILGKEMKIVDVAIKDSITFKGILTPKNYIFIPINFTSYSNPLEKIKTYNRKAMGVENLFEYVEAAKKLLDVPQGGNTFGCYTAIENHYQSTGIEFILSGSEDLSSGEFLAKMNQTFTNLSFSLGSI